MSDEGGAGEPLSDRQKREIAVWFLSNAPAGEIHYVAKDVRALLGDDAVYEAAAAEAFPEYNKVRLVSLELPDRSGDPPAADRLSTLVPMAECKETVKRKVDEAQASDAGASADQSKRQATSQSLPMGAPAATANNNPMLETLPRALRLRVDPSYINTLSARGEIGYRRTTATKELAKQILEINVTELRRCMASVLNDSLMILYFDSGSMRDADINTELKAIVPSTIDVCMTALYAKLYNIHHDYGVHPSRYPTPPSFAKEIELPLPLALLIESFGTFETSCLTTNYLYIPTYPENTQHEGRANAEYPITRYMSYASTFRELKVPMKVFEPHDKSGTPWWTYQVATVCSTHDLICALPPLCTYFSAELCSLLLIHDPDHNNEVQEIVTHPQNVAHYGFRMKALRTGIAVRTFLALCHCPDIIISTYGEIDKNNYLDPRTAQVATIDHMKQTCTKLRPAEDEELPSAYIEEFRCALDVELSKYVVEAYPKGACAVYCTSGKDIEGPGADFSFTAVISAAKRSPQNFCNGSWRSIWTMDFNYELQFVDIKGKIQVDAHYFEEGNVQLDTNIDRKDSTMMQSPDDCAVSITNIIRHHESEYLSSLEESYLNLSDATFKDLRRKLPVTRTLFPWHNTLAFSLTRDLAKELALGK